VLHVPTYQRISSYVFRSDPCPTEFNERDSEFGVRSSGEFRIPNAEIVNFVPDGLTHVLFAVSLLDILNTYFVWEKFYQLKFFLVVVVWAAAVASADA
jgi:hypothetical protein